MNGQGKSVAKPIWSLTWRSVIFLPAMLSAAVLVIGRTSALIGVPLLGAACLYFGLWRNAATCFVVWLLIMYVYRRFRIGQFFERPPSYL
jgi:hypothetical protein